MTKYKVRKKPILVDAYQTDHAFYIDTLEGRMKAEKEQGNRKWLAKEIIKIANICNVKVEDIILD